MNVGQRIRQLREQSNYTQNSLANMANIAQTHLRKVELGQSDITVGHLQLICDALSISLKDFFNIDDEKDDISSAITKLSPRQKQLLLEFLKSL